MSPLGPGDRGCRGQMENWKARRGGGVGRLWPRSENAPGTHVGQGAGSRCGGCAGDSPLPPARLPPPLPCPAPCCRTRRWQARWCSCPRTSPPRSCQPAAGPTSAGRSWPLWGIGAEAPAAERRPELPLETDRGAGGSGGRGFKHHGTAAGCGASWAGLSGIRSVLQDVTGSRTPSLGSAPWESLRDPGPATPTPEAGCAGRGQAGRRDPPPAPASKCSCSQQVAKALTGLPPPTFRLRLAGAPYPC